MISSFRIAPFKLFVLISGVKYLALCGVGVTAESWIEGDNVGFDCEIVLTTTKKEIAIHAPTLVVRVTNYPIFCLSLVIEAPADESDRVVLILPREATVFHGF